MVFRKGHWGWSELIGPFPSLKMGIKLFLSYTLAIKFSLYSENTIDIDLYKDVIMFFKTMNSLFLLIQLIGFVILDNFQELEPSFERCNLCPFK
jgi:hypothetical protein